MPKPGASLKSSLRKSVIGAYRARGRGKGNLWLVSSVKTNSDWILPSDRQFVHWISCLETNSGVISFDLAPEPIISHDDVEPRATELDAIANLKNGHQEWQEVKAGRGKKDPTNRSQFLAQAAAASKAHVEYRVFDDTDLKPEVIVAMRWLKPIAYANAIRGQVHVHCHAALVIYLKEQRSGNIRQILEALPEHDSAVVIGLLVRLAIQGTVGIDLGKMTFGMLTPWKYHG